MKIGLAWKTALKRASLSRNRASLARNSASACFRPVMSRPIARTCGAWLVWMTSKEISIVVRPPFRFRKRHSRSRTELARRKSAQTSSRSSWDSQMLNSVESRPRISSRAKPLQFTNASFTSTYFWSLIRAITIRMGLASKAALNSASLSASAAWARWRSEMSVINAWMICRPLHSIRVSMTSIGISRPSGAHASQSNRALPLVMQSLICLRARISEPSPLVWAGGENAPGRLPSSSCEDWRPNIRTAEGLTCRIRSSSCSTTPWLAPSNSARNCASDSRRARSASLRSVLSMMLARIRFWPSAGRRSNLTSVEINRPSGC